MKLASLSWFLIVLFVLLHVTPSSHACVSWLANVSSADEASWSCSLDLDLVLSNDTLRRAAMSANSDATRKILAHIGVPFIVDLGNPNQLYCLVEVLRFRDSGACVLSPSHLSPRYLLFDSFSRHNLQRRYGEERLESLELVRLPEAWNVVKNSSALPSALDSAEQFIAQLPSANPPGMVLIKLPARARRVDRTRLHARAFFLPLADIKTTVATSTGAVWIHFNNEAPRKRFLQQQLIQSKHLYTTSAYKDRALVPRRWEGKVKEIGQKDQASTLWLNETSWLQRESPKYLKFTVNYASENGSESSSTMVPGSRSTTLKASVACMHFTRAWQTLRRQRVSHLDTRFRQLRRLMGHHHCNSSEQKNAATTPHESSEKTCAIFCQAMEHTREWSARTGQPLSTAQSFAMFVSLFAKNETSSPPLSGSTHEANIYLSSEDGSYFNSHSFLTQTIDFIYRQDHHACGCNVSYQEQGAFFYLTSILQLLQLSESRNITTPQARTRSESGKYLSSHVVVDLYQSMWYGLPHAMAALATLREHGIFLKQNQKAALALLLRSMDGKTLFMYRQLFLHQEGAPKRATQHGSSERDSDRSSLAELLLRQERLYGVLNSFSSLNYPIFSKNSVRAMFLARDDVVDNSDTLSSEHGTDDVLAEEGDAEVVSGKEAGRLSVKLANQVAKAGLLLVGFKGFKQNLHEAECQLLTILRKFGYLCDVALLEQLARDEVRSNSLSYHSRFYDGTCQEHTTELKSLLSNPNRLRISCPAWLHTKYEVLSRFPGLPIPRVEKNYQTLQQTLTLLSYLYLVKMQQYDLVATYASLSVCLSAAAHTVAYEDLRPKLIHQLNALKSLRRRSLDNQQRSTEWKGRGFDHDKFYRQLRNWGEKAFSKALGNSLPYKILNNETEFLALVDSPIASIGHQLTLLAVCALLDQSTKSRKAALISHLGVSSPVQLSASLSHINNLFSHVFRVPFQPSRQKVAFLLLLTAMNQWERTQSSLNVLDQTFLSIHTIDSFVLMTWLLQAKRQKLYEIDNDSTKHKASDEQSFLREMLDLSRRQYRGLVGKRRKFLPMPHESLRSYSRRLLEFSARHILLSESVVELLFSGLASPLNPIDEFAPPYSSFKLLRSGKLRDLDDTHLLPLLYASDIHEYLTRSNWTLLERFSDKVANAFYYLFTETTKESLLRRMGVRILSPSLLRAAAGDDSPETPAQFVSGFLERFGSSHTMRELTVATLLLSIMLVSGEPTAFALVFLEADVRQNAFLAPFADYLAHEVWDDATTARLWLEHHLVAQWHREKAKVQGHGSLLSLDAHSPFRYSPVELRQELMASIDRWRNKRYVHREIDTSNSSHRQHNLKQLHKAKLSLMRCTSQILYAWASALQNKRRLVHIDTLSCVTTAVGKECGTKFNQDTMWLEHMPSTLYDGMFFPAGDAQCALDLYSLLIRMHGDCFTEVMRHNFMTHVVSNLATRLTKYYSLTAEPVLKDKLPTSNVILDDDGSEGGLNSMKEVNYKKQEKSYRFSKQRDLLVEPWNRIGVRGGQGPRISLERGEGVFYNDRLHRVSGLWWGAKAITLWGKVKSWFKFNF